MPDDEQNKPAEEIPATLKDAVFNIFLGWCEGKIGLAQFNIRMKKLQVFYQKKKAEKEGEN